MTLTQRYVCPRCAYSSLRKYDINRHFQRKFVCQPAKSDIELKEDVVKQVLTNYCYVEPASVGLEMVSSDGIVELVVDRVRCNGNMIGEGEVDDSVSLTVPVTRDNQCVQINNTQNIVNINNINSNKINIKKLVIQSDCLDNLQLVLRYHNLKLIGIEDTLEERFKKEVSRFQEAKSEELGLSKHCLLDCVSKTVEAQFPAEFNIIHKTNPNKILIYHDGKWETYLEESGVYRVIKFLRTYVLNDYEIYLLKKLHTGTCRNKLALTTNLETYYKFLHAFDFTPDVEGCTDQFLIGKTIKENNEYSVSEYALKIYQDIKKNVNKAEKRQIYKSVLDIIKGSTANSIQKVNLAMMEILRIDQEFQYQVINKSQTWGLQIKHGGQAAAQNPLAVGTGDMLSPKTPSR